MIILCKGSSIDHSSLVSPLPMIKDTRAAGVGEQILLVCKGRSDVNRLLVEWSVWMFLSSDRHTVCSWAVSVRVIAIAYQNSSCRLRVCG